MGRWVKVLLGPLPATVFLLPLLFAGGLGAAIALIAVLRDPAFSAYARWNSVISTAMFLVWIAAAGVGVLALWRVVLAERPAALRDGPRRWWLASGLAVGLIAAGSWLCTVAADRHSYGFQTWAVWLALLLGPLVLGACYLVFLLRR